MTTSASGQSLKIIPREFASVLKVTMRDNSTNETFTYENINTDTSSFKNYLSFVNQDGYVDSEDNSILKEGRFYDLTVFRSGNVIIFKDKVFVTDQTINQGNNDYYNINSGEYTTDSQEAMNDNDYIIIWVI